MTVTAIPESKEQCTPLATPDVPAQLLVRRQYRWAALRLALRRGIATGLICGLALSAWILYRTDTWRSSAPPAPLMPAEVSEDPVESYLLALSATNQAAVTMADTLRGGTDLQGWPRRSQVPGIEVASNVSAPTAPVEAVHVVTFAEADGNLRRAASIAALRQEALDNLGLVPVEPLARMMLGEERKGKRAAQVFKGQTFDGPDIRWTYVYQPFVDAVVVIIAESGANADYLVRQVTGRFPPPSDGKVAGLF